MTDFNELIRARLHAFPKPHFLGAQDLDPPDIANLLDLADVFVDLNRQSTKKLDLLRGRTLVHMFFEN